MIACSQLARASSRRPAFRSTMARLWCASAYPGTRAIVRSKLAKASANRRASISATPRLLCASAFRGSSAIARSKWTIALRQSGKTPQRDAAVVVRGGVGLVQRDGFADRGGGPLRAPGLQGNHAKQVAGADMVRLLAEDIDVKGARRPPGGRPDGGPKRAGTRRPPGLRWRPRQNFRSCRQSFER